MPFAIRAVLLHGDAAVFRPFAGVAVDHDQAQALRISRDASRVLEPSMTYVATDGSTVQGVQQSALWESARRFVDAIPPNPRASAFAREWYAAASAHILRQSDFAGAKTHLRAWRALHPDDERLAFDAAQLEEALSSARVQQDVELMVRQFTEVARAASRRTAAQGDLARGRDTLTGRPLCSFVPCENERPFGVGTAIEHLREAQRRFTQLVTVAPGRVEARIRLARVTARLGQHDAAVALLGRRAGDHLSSQEEYFRLLFLAASLQASGRPAAALQAYEDALNRTRVRKPLTSAPHSCITSVATWRRRRDMSPPLR